MIVKMNVEVDSEDGRILFSVREEENQVGDVRAALLRMAEQIADRGVLAEQERADDA